MAQLVEHTLKSPPQALPLRIERHLFDTPPHRRQLSQLQPEHRARQFEVLKSASSQLTYQKVMQIEAKDADAPETKFLQSRLPAIGQGREFRRHDIDIKTVPPCERRPSS